MYKGKDGFKIYPHARSKKKLKAKLKTMTNKKRPGTFQEIYADIRRVIIGWMNYYGIAEMKTWAKATSKYAYMAANTRKGIRRAVTLSPVKHALSNQKLEAWVYPSVSHYFELKHKPAAQLKFAF